MTEPELPAQDRPEPDGGTVATPSSIPTGPAVADRARHRADTGLLPLVIGSHGRSGRAGRSTAPAAGHRAPDDEAGDRDTTEAVPSTDQGPEEVTPASATGTVGSASASEPIGRTDDPGADTVAAVDTVPGADIVPGTEERDGAEVDPDNPEGVGAPAPGEDEADPDLVGGAEVLRTTADDDEVVTVPSTEPSPDEPVVPGADEAALPDMATDARPQAGQDEVSDPDGQVGKVGEDGEDGDDGGDRGDGGEEVAAAPASPDVPQDEPAPAGTAATDDAVLDDVEDGAVEPAAATPSTAEEPPPDPDARRSDALESDVLESEPLGTGTLPADAEGGATGGEPVSPASPVASPTEPAGVVPAPARGAAPAPDAVADDAPLSTPVAEPVAEPVAVTGAAASPGSRLGRVLRPRSSRGQILAAVLCAVLGFAMVAQARQTNENGLASLRQSDLVEILSGLNEQSARLEGEIRDLQQTRDELGSDSGDAAQEAAQERLDTLRILTGLAPATGPGIELAISDPQGRVSADELLNAVQELRGAGAEAIQIGDVRVVAQTAFVRADDGVVVDGTALTPPYRIRAIGDPQALSTALNIPGGVLEVLGNDEATGTVRRLDEVQIDALRALPQQRHARPAPTKD